ncbi:CsxC family protein [Halalkalibacter alkalisediminis]|uniref:CsxC family protein n=1 Tax=Halalkalibacter alkalisediminis TaxID=935616 RepID=A0ABV6NPQ5_9BACI|nr:hypothetical protein [Halalkalibacter alkalisediminis]
MNNYKKYFKKTRTGFESCSKPEKKDVGAKKQAVVQGKCPPLKQGDQADVTQADFGAFPLEVEGNVLHVPVIHAAVPLAEIELTANLEAKITLPTPAKEIKNIRKNVFLTQCKAVPSLSGTNFVSLFITGFIHKNIQYADGSGYIRDYEVDVPFSCNQTIELANLRDPALTSLKNTVLERRELAQSKHSADQCQYSQVNFEVFNEPIECKLLATFINEVDILKKYDKRGHFNKITEKMELLLFLKLLQVQQVALNDRRDHCETRNQSVMERIQQLRDGIE